jgi:hypothetical protein
MGAGEPQLFLVGAAGSLRWALPTSAVRAVFDPREVGDEHVIDLARRLRIVAPAQGLRRILAVTASRGERLVRALGQLEVVELAPEAACAIPRLLAGAARRSGVGQVAFPEGGAPLWVLDPDLLIEDDRE